MVFIIAYVKLLTLNLINTIAISVIIFVVFAFFSSSQKCSAKQVPAFCKYFGFVENDSYLSLSPLSVEPFFLKKLWCCVGGRDQNKNLVLSNELIKVELPP